MSDNLNPNESRKDFWKSLKEYHNDPEVLKNKVNEFADGVTDDFNPSDLSAISRRKFIALLSASAAFAATACTDYRDKGEIVPYNQRPEEILPGAANFYASTCSGCSNSCGILIKTREGRPIKIDGNPDHPVNQGKICAKGQASILNLYDPERLKHPIHNRRKTNWSSVDSEIIAELNEALSGGKEIALISNKINSPTTLKVIEDFKARYSNAKLYIYDLAGDKLRMEGWFKSYGSYEYPAIKWAEANVILSIDSDFLGSEGNYIENTREFTKRREAVSKIDFNRLYVAEGRMSTTGMMADYRIRVSPSEQYRFVMGLINELLKRGSAVAVDSAARSKFEQYSLAQFEKNSGERIKKLVEDLNSNRGKSIVHCGDTMPVEVHVAVNLLNEILGNTALYDYSKSFNSLANYSSNEEIAVLINAMNSGSVGVVIHLDSNPVYHLPEDSGYLAGLKKVKTVITLTEAETETSSVSNYVLPINNQLENWGDSSARYGVYSLQQPVISPIFQTRQKEAVLLTWLVGDSTAYNPEIYHNYLIENFQKNIYNSSNSIVDARTFWFSSLHDGFVKLNETAQPAKFNFASVESIDTDKNKNGVTLHLTPGFYIGDGKFANNGWLQELPHPVTKITWDNYAAISPATAKRLGVEMNDLVEVNSDGKKLTLPVVVQPGMSDETVHVELGYGRTTGEVAKEVGSNAANLIPRYSAGSSFVLTGIAISKVDGNHKLATTQEHHSLDDTFVKDFHRIRNIIQEGTVEKYKNNPGFLHSEKHEIFSITKEHQYTANKWAMAIDLNKCTSCGACVSACNVENNVPVVGKDQVLRGREMQWLRLDRYYSGTPEEPITSTQPMLCQHCDNAPCENVCPVNATNHSPDGLNQMAYNRCVGTRYCSNNCPYKVRRFNFFDFRDHFADAYYQNDLTALVHNPEVTVRSRGVMEKCTFCVQRIMEARSDAIKDGRELKGSDIVTACQQACPANAIVFGDANDPQSPVAKLREHNLSYHVLETLNVKPNVTYIAKLRNTHSEEIS